MCKPMTGTWEPEAGTWELRPLLLAYLMKQRIIFHESVYFTALEGIVIHLQVVLLLSFSPNATNSN